MSETQRIINRLVQERKEGTKELYSQIPFFMRTRLYVRIDGQSWAGIAEACDNGDQAAIQKANQMYTEVLQEMDEYIARATNESHTDNSVLMMQDRYWIQSNFGTDGIRFVKEVAACLKKETQLIFLHKKSGSSEGAKCPDLLPDTAGQLDDMDLQAVEQLHERIRADISTAARIREEHSRLPWQNTFGNFHSIDENAQEDSTERISSIREQLSQYENMLCETQSRCQSAMDNFTHLKDRSMRMLEKLAVEINEWKKAEAKRSVKIGPDTNRNLLFSKFERFARVLSIVRGWFRDGFMAPLIQEEAERLAQNPTPLVSQIEILNSNFNEIVKRLLQIGLVVTMQPKGVISIENKGSKESPNYCTKKTQPFFSAIRVLGAECFPDLVISNQEVELIADRLSAHQTPAPIVGKNNKSCLEASQPDNSGPGESKFKLEIRSFLRVEQNTVYKQFFRLLYRVSVSLDTNTAETLTIVSLPFTFNTGANQILEHMGARMLYFGAVDDMYCSGCRCPDPIPLDTVVDILDRRVLHLDNSQSKTKRRRPLTQGEKEFLKSRLPASTEGMVTIQGFLKDKLKKVGGGEEPLNFSFYTWFSSVINTLETVVGGAWTDGLIYGFGSSQMAERILLKKDIPESTFLLRPSNSNVNNTSSADATADLVIEMKFLKMNAAGVSSPDQQYEVVSLCLYNQSIRKHTLYGLVKTIERDGKRVARYLFGQNGHHASADELKGYGTKNDKRPDDGYKAILRKIQKFSIHMNQQSASPADDLSDENDSSDHEPKRRKRKFNRSQSSASSASSQDTLTPSQSVGDSRNDWPSGMSTSQYSAMPSHTIVKQEVISVGSSSSCALSQGQGERSGIQDFTVPGQIGAHSANQNSQNRQTGQESTYTQMGNILIDLSNIPVCPENGLSQISGNDGHHWQVISSETPQMLTTMAPYTSPTSMPNITQLPETPESLHSSMSHRMDSSPESSPYSQASVKSVEHLPTVLDEAFVREEPSRGRNGNNGGNGGRNNRRRATKNNGQAVTQNAPSSLTEISLSTPKVIVEENYPIDNMSSEFYISNNNEMPLNINDLQPSLGLAISELIYQADFCKSTEYSPTDSGLCDDPMTSPERESL